MQIHSLLNLSPLDGRYHEKLMDLRPILSEYGLFYYRTWVEVKWFEFLAQEKIGIHDSLSDSAFSFMETILEKFSVEDALRIKEIEKTTNHDVKAVEYFIKEKMITHAELKDYVEWIHFACTSEDINNLSYALMLKNAWQKIILPHMDSIGNKVKTFAEDYAHIPMLARTHGQSASPTTVGKEFANVFARLERQLSSFKQQQFLGKFNGAVGNYNAHCIAFSKYNWPEIAEKFVSSLGLMFNPMTTQIEPHDYLAEFNHHLIRWNTILIDLARDIWAYISLNYLKQKVVLGEVGSSTMPHKVNPIDFENAEGNLSLANAILSFLSERLPISRWQRDLVDSTLLRNMAVALGHSYLGWTSLLKGFSKLDVNIDVIREDLAQHPEVLAEAIQTVMRAKGIDQAYEKLKDLTRGKILTLEVLKDFILTLPLSEEEKTELLKLEPKTYIGLAEKLARG